MKKIILTLVLSANIYGAPDTYDGFWVELESFVADYRTDHHFDWSLAKNYIIAHNRHAQADAAEIVDNIVKTSECLKLDPLFLLAKVHRESTFYVDAESSTQAAGLSQMTSIAIKEVRDQLGIRGRNYARPSIVNNLTETLQTCMGQQSFLDFFELHQNKTYRQIKEVYKENIKFSLFAGAIVLKVFMAEYYDDSKSLTENYRKALEEYNGEPTKKDYADKIIEKVQEIKQLFSADELRTF